MSLTPEQYIQSMLFHFAWQEGVLHGGSNNMLAVAFVIRNRVKAGWFAGDWLQVIAHSNDVVGTFKESAYNLIPDMRKPEIRQLMSKIPDIYSGLEPDRMTEGALYYGELASIDNKWFQENILSNLMVHKRVATVGPVSFFT